MDKVSVIIPCYNVELYVAECLNSVLHQTHKNIEIICVNDSSSDNTLNILNHYKDQYPSLITIISIPNKGAAIARNSGLKYAQGDFIQFLDADDIITHDKFEKQLAGFTEDVDMVVSDRMQKNNDLSKILNTYYFNDIEKEPLNTVITKIVSTCNPLYRKNVITSLGGHSKNLNSAQDWEFHIRLVLANHKIKYVPGVYFISRKVEGSVSSNWIKVSIQMAEVILKLKPTLLESNLINKTAQQYFAQIYTDSAIYCHDKNQSEKYIDELKYWMQNDYTFINNIIKRVLVKLIGINIVINIQRIIKRKYNIYLLKQYINIAI